MTSLKIAAAMAALLVTTATVNARGCDGFNRCRCGVTAAQKHGLPLNYNGFNLKLASDWKRAFPRTSAGPGVVVFQNRRGGSGHVTTITSMTGTCTAMVSDDGGQYERNICGRGAVYLAVSGSASFAQAEHTYSARSKRGRHQRQVAVSVPSIFDRFNAH